MRRFLALLLTAAVSSCAHQSAQTTRAPPLVARDDVARHADPNPASAIPVASSTPEPGNPLLLKQGYKPLVKHGETYYCRKELVTGSRFSTVVCLTPEQIENMKQAAQDVLTGPQVGCGSSGGCFGNGK